MAREIPKVKIAVVGGSAITSSSFPEGFAGIDVLESGLVFDTPFGPTAPFTLARADGKQFLFVVFHGLTQKIHPQTPDSGFERNFYVLQEAGVKKIIGCATGGSYNMLLNPGDFVVPHGAVDLTTKRAVSLSKSLADKGIVSSKMIAIRMRQPFCPTIQRILYEEARANKGISRVFDRGVIGCEEGPEYGTPEEGEAYATLGCDVGTNNLFPELSLAREIGAHYSYFNLIVNFGEIVEARLGLHTTTMDELPMYEKFATPCAEVIASTLRRLDAEDESCGCMKYRTVFERPPTRMRLS